METTSSFRLAATACAGIVVLLPLVVRAQAAVELPRDFVLDLPLFAGSAWTEDASGAAVLPDSPQQVLVTYRVLCGDTTDLHPVGSPPYTDWPFADVNSDDYSVAVCRATGGSVLVDICDYEGWTAWPGAKWPNNVEGGPIFVPAAAVGVRPAGPQSTDADGHLALVDPAAGHEVDFWQATTSRSGVCQSFGAGILGPQVLEAGAADYFELAGRGSNRDGMSSARAMGVPLLAGLLLPEDVLVGGIEHAVAVAIPGPRNLSPDPSNPLPTDWYYPAATTETDYYSSNPMALAAGQRLRLRPSLVDDSGDPVVESSLAPITRMFLAALRSYGAYVVDNAGGFSFYAEDIHTAVLPLSDDDVNALIGQPAGTPLPTDRTRWQLVIETLNLELESIPFAFGNCDAAASTVTTANFEVVEPAGPPAHVFADGFESSRTEFWSFSIGD